MLKIKNTISFAALFCGLLICLGAPEKAAAQKPDLTIKSVSRVKSKIIPKIPFANNTPELQITVANESGVRADNTKVTVYALPYGFYNAGSAPFSLPWEYSGNAYLETIQKAEKELSGKTPSQILTGDFGGRINNAHIAFWMQGLAWAKVEVETNVAENATRELIVTLPKKYTVPADAKSKIIYPIPFVHYQTFYHYAPVGIAAFDYAVFFVVVTHASDTNYENNRFFYNPRVRHPGSINIPPK